MVSFISRCLIFFLFSSRKKRNRPKATLLSQPLGSKCSLFSKSIVFRQVHSSSLATPGSGSGELQQVLPVPRFSSGPWIVLKVSQPGVAFLFQTFPTNRLSNYFLFHFRIKYDISFYYYCIPYSDLLLRFQDRNWISLELPSLGCSTPAILPLVHGIRYILLH